MSRLKHPVGGLIASCGPSLPAMAETLLRTELERGSAVALFSLPAAVHKRPGWLLLHGVARLNTLKATAELVTEPRSVYVLPFEWCASRHLQVAANGRLYPVTADRPALHVRFSEHTFFPACCEQEPRAKQYQHGPLEVPRFWQGPDRTTYLGAVQQIRAWIRAGDLYQLNLTRMWHRSESAGTVLRRWLTAVRRLTPPFAAFVSAAGQIVASLSPEELFCMHDTSLRTAPIKGTETNTIHKLESTKNRAEHLMIVDLERNDLGRLCIPGSIRTDPLTAAIEFQGVRHYVSLVQGIRRPEVTASEILTNLAPGGSITGAPKIRVLERTPLVEDEPRGIYCGALGLCAPDESLQFSLPIRTLEWQGGRSRFGSGGGIVHDSDAEQEWQEMLYKQYWLRAGSHRENK